MRFLNANDPAFRGTDDASTIQNAVNAAESGPVRTVCIPRHCERTGEDVWHIGHAVLLPSDITVLLDDCRLVLDKDIYDNIFRNRNMYSGKDGGPGEIQHGIRIIGNGNAVLDGGEGNDLRESTSRKNGRPHVRFNNFILLNNVTDYTLQNFKCENMRWWAINQIACTDGHLSDLRFWNGEKIPNQDGINLRIGCARIVIENISGRTGDDCVALSAFPLGTDNGLLPEGMSPDIHDVTVRNVYGHTRQTVVALRCCDGAKIWRVNIENIHDIGGEYGPWGVVRIGENNYYKKRPNVLGEMSEINVRGVYSRCRGTVFINSSLKDSRISDVYAGGTSMYAVSTFMPTAVSAETGCLFMGGVDMRNVVIENIHYNGTAGHCNEEGLSFPGEPYHGAALDFRCMREGDRLEHVIFRDIFNCEGSESALFKAGYAPDIR